MAKTKQVRRGFIQIEEVIHKKSGQKEWYWRTVASNGRKIGWQGELMQSMASVVKNIYANAEVFGGVAPFPVQLINCKLPKKDIANFVEIKL